MPKRLSQNEFIQRAIEVHGTKYDYSKVDYVNFASKIEIICPTHGSFAQTGVNHVIGRAGCARCSGTQKSTTEEFVSAAKKRHGDRYDYSQVVYKNNKSEVVIGCPIHGIFFKRPDTYLRGYGCPKCSKRCPLTTDIFIQRAREKHGDRFDYSKVQCAGNRVRVIITCIKHGDFEQAPHEHLIGVGCPSCQESRGEKLVSRVLENMKLEYKRQFTFKQCKLKKCLPFDFWVKLNNGKTFLIEYQGSHHYEPTRWCKSLSKRESISNYQKTIQRDRIKRNFAAKENIPLLLIPYWEKPNMQNIIADFVNSISIS
jgi:hypothetical protein